MKKILFLLLLSGLALSSCNRKTAQKNKKPKTTTKVVTKGVHFKKNESFAKVLKKAKATNKPIFIDFYTTWCAPCKWMDSDVFELKVVGDLFNDNFISLKVDAEKGEGPMLAAQFGVRGYPMLVYLDSNGDMVDSQLGMTTATNVMDKARRTITHNNAINGAGSR